MLSSTFFAIFKLQSFGTIYFLFPSFELQNLKKKKRDILPLVLRTLNFEDKIYIRRGECNTPIKANPFCETKSFPWEQSTKVSNKSV
jgi:hypothetical protein